MLTDQHKEYIKATVPILKENGLALTTYFYQRMFRHNPELKNIFNQGNQHSSKQPTALAMAILAYAEHIDDPSVLVNALTTIGHKHVSLNIRPEQYTIVGEHLLASISEVLSVPPDSPLVDAWSLAYAQLVALMTNVESQLYQETINKPGGWNGWRPFILKRKVRESTEITSFYLYPGDGGQVVNFLPGQYVSIRLFLPELNLMQPRQYSLSCAPNGHYYRISVKREIGLALQPDGMISNRLHDFVQEGDYIELTAPAGNFTLQSKQQNPIVFISGGVGQTPLLSMAEYLINSDSQRDMVWVHGARNETVHAFKELLTEWEQRGHRLKRFYFYEQSALLPNPPHTITGRVDMNQVKKAVLLPNATYYLCGPGPFLNKQYKDLITLGVQQEAIYFEEFGPQTLSLNTN